MTRDADIARIAAVLEGCMGTQYDSGGGRFSTGSRLPLAAALYDAGLRPSAEPAGEEVERLAEVTKSPKEWRRLAVEAFIDAHYDVGCDAVLELDWFEHQPDAARAVVAALILDENRPRAVIRRSLLQRFRWWIAG